MNAHQRKDRRRRYLAVLVLLFCAVMMYQATLSMFLVLSLPFLVLESCDARSFLKNNVSALLLYAIPNAFSMTLLKVVIKSSRITAAAADPLSERICTVTENIFRVALAGGHTFIPMIALLVTAFFAASAVGSGKSARERGKIRVYENSISNWI